MFILSAARACKSLRVCHARAHAPLALSLDPICALFPSYARLSKNSSQRRCQLGVR
jgi:hypothetical protein